jgi:hypothetical protein
MSDVSEPRWPEVPTVGQPVVRDLSASGFAVASMVLGITSIVFCWWGLGSLAQVVLAIVFGANGIRRANQGTAGGKGMATAGLACGIVGFIAYFIVGIVSLGVGFLI